MPHDFYELIYDEMEEGYAKGRARYLIDLRDDILLKKPCLDASLPKIDEQLMKIISGE